MKKELTNIEILKTTSNIEYYKVHFGSQWFMVTPWHYHKASLMKLFDVIKLSKVGDEYDIKWRVATINNKSVTLLTHYAKCEVEFRWESEEQGGESVTQAPPQVLTQKASNHTTTNTKRPEEQLDMFTDLDDFDEDWFPF